MPQDISSMLSNTASTIQNALQTYFQNDDKKTQVIFDAARYSLLAGGKRIRPFLVLQFSELFHGSYPLALSFACALEMIHTYSLIHDDLPCMDNDDLRRGKPTNHKVYGEDMALLAGDALLTQAFQVLSDNHADVQKEQTTALRLAAVQILAENAGVLGMIGGQVLDLNAEKTPCDFDTLLQMHEKKTTALIRAACLLGCVSAGFTDPDSPQMKAACAYAYGVGLSFQIIDDLLDCYGDSAVLGKNTGSDAANKKTTFLTYMSESQARAYAKDLTEHAKDALCGFAGNKTLCALADMLLERQS